MRHVVCIVIALVLAACGDDDGIGDERAAQVREAAVEAGLDEEIADFLALASRGQTAVYQATYPGPEPGTDIVVASRPPERRVDLVDGDRIVETRLVLDGEAFTCRPTDRADGEVDCERTDALVEPPGLFGDDALSSLTASLRERADQYDFSLERTPIAGVEASCLVTGLRPGIEDPELGASGSLCVSDEGVLLRVVQSDEVVEATSYSTDIPDNTFRRPDQKGDE